ncbi:hypothetical protein FKM82_006869 [Ascaphus truei]
MRTVNLVVFKDKKKERALNVETQYREVRNNARHLMSCRIQDLHFQTCVYYRSSISWSRFVLIFGADGPLTFTIVIQIIMGGGGILGHCFSKAKESFP